MPASFDLIISADYPNRTAELRLLDAHGFQLAFRQTDFKTIALSHQRGLFDLRNYLRHYAAEGEEAARVAEIGVLIAEHVLGEEIFRMLWESEAQRTLRIQLPGASEEENHLVAALARVPWEIARPSAGKQALSERNLLVRVVHDMAAPPSQPLELRPDESLRALFVFAEAPGSRPLAARKERRELLNLFEKEIYPQRRVIADFLTHGVTRERLKVQIRENGGYHIVHWSGHGHLNLLELAKPGGGKDHLSGDELLDLFVKAGGFIPRLCFLSACHSGDILSVKDWNDFMSVAQGKEPGPKQATTEAAKDIEMEEQPGYTGTAHALLQGGVPSVIAMRYAVGDEYARDLSVEFYRSLLAHARPKNAAAALTMARQSLLDPAKSDLLHYAICDHATPVLYGENDPGLSLQQGRSPGLNTRNPRLHQIVELTTAGHEHFVGRSWELADLGAEFIGASRSAEVKPVAVITGLGGMGKTALTAEALPEVETRLARVEAWWRQHASGQPAPEAPDPTLLARVYISALDIATQAHNAREDWAASLPRIDAIIAAQLALERPAEDIAAMRVNRAVVLGGLGRFGEAQTELEACLQLFQHDPARSAAVLSSLADLFYDQGDVAQAIRQERRALALFEQLPDPRSRATSHHSLANYLERSGSPSALAESSRHRLADLVYSLVVGQQYLQTSLRNYAILLRLAKAAGTTLAVPSAAELLADPAFRPLDDWLRRRQVDVDELQIIVDGVLEMARQAALEQE
jgi:tetratricopeptide (TPR) repeat protein